MFGKHIFKSNDFWMGITCAGILMSSIYSITDAIKFYKKTDTKIISNDTSTKL